MKGSKFPSAKINEMAAEPHKGDEEGSGVTMPGEGLMRRDSSLKGNTTHPQLKTDQINHMSQDPSRN